MVGPRHATAAAAVALVLSLPVASCVAIVGADDEGRVSAVNALCFCLIQSSKSFLGGQKACETTVGGRLSSATEETRGEWMKQFNRLRCDLCTSDNPLKCYHTAPTCSKDGCGQSSECCPGMTCDETTSLCMSANP